jgi:hypothetical protein
MTLEALRGLGFLGAEAFEAVPAPDVPAFDVLFLAGAAVLLLRAQLLLEQRPSIISEPHPQNSANEITP